MPNTELLERVMQHIDDHPEVHNQGIWVSECGTAACFAGWTLLLSGARVAHYGRGSYFTSWEGADGQSLGVTSHAAQALLGLKNSEAERLFEGGNTRDMLRLMVKDLVNGDALRPLDDYRDYD